jgi:hypothetical protein
MEIPKQVTVGRTKYTINVSPHAISHRHYGGIHYGNASIYVAQRAPYTNKPVSKRAMAHTFWHELTHAILHDMKHPLSADEVFVEKFSKRLNDAIFSAKF